MRVSLKELLAITFVVAMACLALGRPTATVSAIVFAFTLACLLTSVLCAVALVGVRRFYWIGFAIGGIAYLWLAHEPMRQSDSMIYRFNKDETMLTTGAFNWLWVALERPEDRPAWAKGMGEGGMGGGGMGGMRGARPILTHGTWRDYDGFIRSGNCLFAMLIAWMSGHFTLSLRQRAIAKAEAKRDEKPRE